MSRCLLGKMMKHTVPAASLFLLTSFMALPVKATITLVGEGVIPATATDQSRLTGLLEDGQTRRNQIGGLGGAISYSGFGERYYAVPDRGPGAGETSYIERIYRLDIHLTRIDADHYHIQPRVTRTQLMRTEDGRLFTGYAGAFDATQSPASLRMDAESIRVGKCGDTVYVSEEYGPFLYEFDLASGRRIRSLPIPIKFLIDFPAATAEEELEKNLTGRQTNRGLEGLAITPDGHRLVAILQDPLLQDSAFGSEHKPVGVANRLLDLNLETGDLREYVYLLESPENGVSEILAINEHEFLVLERDTRSGAAARFKKIFRIDLGAASNVRAVKSLPINGASVLASMEHQDIVPAAKTLFLDLLQAGIHDMPEKMEGLTFGPDLEDGRHLLIISSDNDFSPIEPTRIFVFAVGAEDLPGYSPQRFLSDHDPSCVRGSHKHSKKQPGQGIQ